MRYVTIEELEDAKWVIIIRVLEFLFFKLVTIDVLLIMNEVKCNTNSSALLVYKLYLIL